MSRERDTDTLTRIDLGPDAPTVRADSAGSEAETHKLDPRVYAPLRVCPECSLAWETTGKWCPSCGTAFSRAERESSTATRVMPRRPAEPPLTRSARRHAAASAAPAAAASGGRVSGPPRREQPSGSGGSFAKSALVAVLLVGAMAGAFLIGQSTRPSQADVDQSIEQAVDTAKRSAAESYQTAFDKLQAKTEQAIADARSKALAEGQAKAQEQLDAQQQESQSIFDSVTECVLHGNC